MGRLFGRKHYGHILSICVRSFLVKNSVEKISKHIEDYHYSQFALVGDLMQSVSLLHYSPEYHSLHEIARDMNSRSVTVIEMLTNDIYIVAEDSHNIFILRRNTFGIKRKVKYQLDTVGIIHIGEMLNNIMKGSLAVPFLTFSIPKYNTNDTISLKFNLPRIKLGSQSLFATSDG